MLKPRIVLSSCLNLERTRYDGKIFKNPQVLKLKKFFEVISVCPEIGIGLPVPRDKIILYKKNSSIRAIQIPEGIDLTQKLIDFSTKFLKNLPDVEGFLLKSKSPSCGVSFSTKTYKDPQGKIFCGKYQGIFAKEVLKTFTYLPVVDEKSLENKEVLENFLIRIFALRKWREFKENMPEDKNRLLNFHRSCQCLLMSYAPSSIIKIEKILFAELNFSKLLKFYENLFKRILASPFRKGKHINVWLYLWSKFNKKAKSSEKRHLFYLIEQYKKSKISIFKVIFFLKSLSIKYNCRENLDQIYLNLFTPDFYKLFFADP